MLNPHEGFFMLGRPGLGGGKSHSEDGSTTCIIGCDDLTPVQIDDGLDDGQPQTGARGLAARCPRLIDPEESIEDPAELVCRYSRPGIGHL